MKKASLLLVGMLLTVFSAIGQYNETLNIEKAFDNVRLEGNIRLYLKEGSKTEVSLETRNQQKMEDYRITVQNNTLYIRLREKQRYGGTRKRHSAPKIKINLTHPELKGVNVEGLVSVYSIDPVSGDSFSVKGDGLIRGKIEVDVQRLEVDLDGLCSMRFSGKADESDLRLDGMGKIKARNLETSKVNKSADGLTSIGVAKL
ncbi:GIN domain-containing protein [Maribacter sp. 4G9]|uniref:GIN domain-containing protein n=1 Tax=Maribacter sp. 4G9 TaxID=1889777 RepID=UPI000C14FD56|nr:DUF2807 domain-containing protein [Maribacter sp. 4G9]PIB31430.1 hypothetical protein BFP75_01400 [Maribacter sp. 4G9]